MFSFCQIFFFFFGHRSVIFHSFHSVITVLVVHFFGWCTTPLPYKKCLFISSLPTFFSNRKRWFFHLFLTIFFLCLVFSEFTLSQIFLFSLSFPSCENGVLNQKWRIFEMQNIAFMSKYNAIKSNPETLTYGCIHLEMNRTNRWNNRTVDQSDDLEFMMWFDFECLSFFE